MSHFVLVSFSGAGSGDEELTWGQRSVWQTTLAYGGPPRTVAGVDPLPPGTTVRDAAETVRFAMSRHQALRTRLRFDGGRLPRQVCSASGQIALEVVDAGEADPAEVAHAVRRRYQSTDVDYENEWPVRMAVVCRDGMAAYAVAVYLHLVIDAGGLRALLADLRHLAPGWETTAPPVTALQPLDQARQQRTPAVRRQAAASLRHLRRVLLAAPADRFGPPSHDEPDDPASPDAGLHQLRLRSPATRLAMGTVAARNGVGTSSVLLAAFAVAMTRFTGIDPVFVMLMVGNRFRPGLADSVSGITQSSPCLLDAADTPFDQVVARASHLAMAAYKYAYYDPYERDEVMAAVNRERGETVDFSCYFNDRRPPDAGPPQPAERHRIREALSLGSVHWDKDVGRPRQKFFLGVDDRAHAIDFAISADRRYFTRDDLVGIALGMESVIVDAALGPDRADEPIGIPARRP